MKNKSYLFFIGISLLTGVVSAVITMDSMNIYSTIQTPTLSPPGFLFPIVWTILFTLMGIGAARVYNADRNNWSKALSIWAIQLFFNFMWSVIFFNMQAFLFAFIWLIALWSLIITMIILFYKKDRFAAYLQIPYLLWVTFAGYLNFAIYLLN